MTYEETIAWLAGLEVSSGWDLKLERMRAAVARRGHPEARWPALHVAGTNGKGSAAAMLDAVLTAAGYRTGLYTSPHLIDFSERMRVGGRTIPHAAVVELVAELRADLEPVGIALTHFEFATLIAFEWFARVGIDVGVIEVGLGGRLDATNLVRPAATAITSIAVDHVEYLGPDLASIAAEKAGIAKPGVPLAVGRLPAEAMRVVLARAAEVGAPVARVGVDARLEAGREGLAFSGLGLTWTRWPGRLAVIRERPLILLDGAHNPAGAAALAAELPGVVGDRPLVLVFAVMGDKDWRAMLEPLLPRVKRVIVTRVSRRGADPGAVAAALAPRVPAEALEDARAALNAAVDRAEVDDAVLVTGSLFLVGEAYAVLGGRGGATELFQPWQPPEADA